MYLAKQKTELFDGSIEPLFGGVFGIYGHGNVAGIGEALWKYRQELPYFRGQNEQGMAHTAIAYAKAHRGRRVMGVTTSIGPGATNMVTAAALAHVNRLPVLFLPGDIFTTRRPDPVLQQLENPHSPLTSVNDCFIPVSQFFDRITHPEQLLQSLPQAVQTLMHPTTRGPVTLSLPQDTQTEAYEFPLEFFREQVHYISRPQPDSREVERAAAVLKQSRRPLIIAGGGVHYSGAEEALREFAESRGIPVAETQAGKGSLSSEHRLSLGGIGVTGTAAANAIAREADCILAIGTRLGDFTTASKSLFHREEVPIIALNTSPMDTAKVSGRKIIGDALAGLKTLDGALGDWAAIETHESTVAQAKADWNAMRAEIMAPQNSLPTDAQVLGAVEKCVGEKDVIVCAAGGMPGELHKLWNVRDPLAYHLEYGYSCMGYEIAGGLGVKMALPEREVYVVVGDGSYLMLHTELLTARQLGYKINVILLDNHGFGCINRLQKACGSSPYGNIMGREPQVDFAANAKSYGCHAKKVNNLEELQQTLRENRTVNLPCVTVIETDPEQGSPGTAWWDVAIPEQSNEPGVRKAFKEYQTQKQTIYPRSPR